MAHSEDKMRGRHCFEKRGSRIFYSNSSCVDGPHIDRSSIDFNWDGYGTFEIDHQIEFLKGEANDR